MRRKPPGPPSKASVMTSGVRRGLARIPWAPGSAGCHGTSHDRTACGAVYGAGNAGGSGRT
jgi:hypothetical protein